MQGSTLKKHKSEHKKHKSQDKPEHKKHKSQDKQHTSEHKNISGMTKNISRDKMDKYMQMLRQRNVVGRASEGLRVKKG